MQGPKLCYIQQDLTVITLVLKYMSLRKTFDFSLDDKFSTIPKRSILHSNQLNHLPKYQQNPSVSQPFNKHLNPFHSYLPNEASTNCEKQSSIGKLSFHNADKLRRFEELKESNIDDLNCKIKKMISKLSEVVSPTNSSAASSYYDSKVKFKTEYSDYYEDDNKLKGESMCIRDVIQESKVVKGLPDNYTRLDKIPQKNRVQNADTIRRKYKDESHRQMETRTKHEKCKSGLNAFASNETIKQASQNADFIRFKQKLKQNTQKDRQQLGIELKYSSNTKQTLSKDQNTKSKRDLDIKMKDYQKKLNTYNSKKLLLLSSEGDIERIVLGDKTNNNNTFYKYSPYSNKQSIHYQPKFQLKIKPKQPISHFEETDRSQQPLTADFRQLTDKNQLQVLLKHLCNQIVHDQQFRNAKKWFSRITIEKKWDNLLSIIQNKNLDLDENAMHQIFGMKDQQQNPFYTPRDNEFSIENLVQLFVKSQEYWFDNIVKRYNHERLFQAGFKNSRIDTIGKGYLTVEDFVRFINMEADQQMRNRDLHLIFERLRGQEQLTFEQLVQVICQ